MFFKVLIPFLLMMRSNVVNKPKLRGIVHMGKIEIRKKFSFLLHLMTNVTTKTKDLSKDRMHFHFNTPSSKYLVTSL